ncbi:MAG: trypsin-like peptidase domain-containing protein [Phycisphaerae bacterium]
MAQLRKTVVGLGLIGALGLGAMVGSQWAQEAAFARDKQAITDARQELADNPTIQNLSGVFRAVGRATEPSVVHLDVSKRVENMAGSSDMLRRFFDREGIPPEMRPEVPGGPQEERDFFQRGTGSGVIMEAEGGYGYVLTNFHVAGEADEIRVTLADGRTITAARVIGTDPQTDLALVRIEADRLIPAEFGDSDKLERGDIILAFGSPFGYVGSMTQGIVSATGRNDVGILRRQSQFAYENFIQVDAPINPGNSGGPLVNLAGEVVGINTAIATRTGGFSGIGFAIPSNQAREVYQALREEGRVTRGYLGVSIADVSRVEDVARAAGYEKLTGVFVSAVLRGSPAFGQLKPGDVVTGLDGRPIERMQELRNYIAAKRPGTEVKLDVWREGQTVQVSVTLAEQPSDPMALRQAAAPEVTPEVSDVGVRLGELDDARRRTLDVPEQTQGAVVLRVQPNSPAATAGLTTGDVITRVGTTPVTNADEAREALASADLRQGVTLMVTSREGSRFVLIRSE